MGLRRSARVVHRSALFDRRRKIRLSTRFESACAGAVSRRRTKARLRSSDVAAQSATGRGCIRCRERSPPACRSAWIADRSQEALPLHPMAEVTLYTKPMCRHCFRARRRLRRRGATIHEIRIGEDIDRMRAEFRDRFGAETFRRSSSASDTSAVPATLSGWTSPANWHGCLPSDLRRPNSLPRAVATRLASRICVWRFSTLASLSGGCRDSSVTAPFRPFYTSPPPTSRIRVRRTAGPTCNASRR